MSRGEHAKARAPSEADLPTGWPRSVKSALLQVIALAGVALSHVRGGRRASEVERLQTELGLVQRQLRLVSARLSHVPPRHRPHYTPTERLEILELRAACGCNVEQTAEALGTTPETIATWVRRVDEQGAKALVRMGEPVNRFPEFVALVVQRLKVLCPLTGKVRIAQTLARAGLQLAPRTVRRMLDKASGPEPDPETAVAKSTRGAGHSVIARYPNHVWSFDHAVVPTRAGFWVPWIPSAVVQRWPYCYWVSIVLDHVSRRVMGFDVFDRQPSADQVCAMLDVAVARARRAPKYTVTDQGGQFREEHLDWCERNAVKPRYGAVGERGSIAKIQRFMLTLKDEYFRRFVVPYALADMHEHVARFVTWYGEHRPHQGLRGATLNEVYFGRKPAHIGPRFEPRARYPSRRVRRRRGGKLEFVVSHLDGSKELPIVQLRRAT